MKNFEMKCFELFGECPLDIHDIAVGKALDYSESDLIFEVAKKVYKKSQNEFYKAMCSWMDGNKPSITMEEAQKRNKYYRNAKYIVDNKISTAVDSIVNWEAFPNDDPSIILYFGLPFDSDICLWAGQYKKTA